MVHGIEVLLPLRIHHLKHDDALVGAHQVCSDGRLFLLVLFEEAFLQLVSNFVPVRFIPGDSLERAGIEAVLAKQGRLKGLDIPILGFHVFGEMLIE